jgi:malate dehydrogenase (oxaloacetate-decarboxylating)
MCIVQTKLYAAVSAIAPSFGGINLEDIAAPICFEVEDTIERNAYLYLYFMMISMGRRLLYWQGLINAMKVTGRSLA